MKCMLNKEPFYQCCCSCKELKVFYNNDEKGNEYADGWACLLFQDDGFVVKSDAHSIGCECFNDKRKVTSKGEK